MRTERPFTRLNALLVASLLLIVSSCSDSSSDPQPENGVLIDATLSYSTTASQVKLLIQFSGLPVDVNEFKYDIDLYKVTYRTTYKGAEITASGLIVLPKTSVEIGMLSFQHGTITTQSDAPSNFSSSDPDAILYGALSSSGFITVIPDYIGFGASSTSFHPYFVEELTASAVVDMLAAARELAEDKGITFNKKLFLAGYSEGGYATMATHKSIEEHSLEGFDLVASFAGAGAYDVKKVQEYFFAQPTYDDPYYLAYIARAYQVTYDHSTILTDFFNEPYAGKIPGLFDGLKQAEEIDAQLNNDIAMLIPEDLRLNIDTDADYAYIVDALEENSLIDWAPTKKMYLYHGTSDTTIPYQNSADTYDALIDQGASPSVLSLTSLEGNHGSAITPYIVDFVPKLWALR